MTSFRAQFRRFRRTRRVTQVALARALDISAREVKYIEAGVHEPRWSTVEKFKALVEKHKNAEPKGRHIYG